MKYTLRPLQWDKVKSQHWMAEGITHIYSTHPEYDRIRLYCSQKAADTRAELYDFDSYHDMMHFAEKHHTKSALKFLKEV